MSLVAALTWALLALSAACLLIGVSIGARRALRRTALARRERLAEPLRPTLLDLVGGDPQEVAAATEQLRALGSGQWDAVRDVLVDFCAKFRGESLRPVLAVLAAHSVVADSLADLAARSAVRRGRAAYTLGLLRVESACVGLQRLLGDHDPDVRIAAARALGRIGDPAAANALLGALSGSRTVPPGAVTGALLDLGADGDGPVREALGAPDPVVRAVAVEIAGLRGALALADPVRSVLAADPDPQVRLQAAASLGRLGTSAALPELLAATGPHEHPAVRLAAVAALGAVGHPDATGTLAALMTGHDLLADEAARALVRLGPAGMTVLLEHEVPGVRSPAAGVLAVARLRKELPTADTVSR